MKRTLAIAQRELMSLFYSPIAYLVLAVFSFGAAVLFVWQFIPGGPATMRGMFWGIVWLMVLLVPAISMRLVSEELRTGTIEPLMTAPLSDGQVVMGKWLGAMAFVAALLLLPLTVLTAALEMHADPEIAPIVVGCVGLLLVGGLYLAIGTFASALTQNQIIAFVMTILIICLFTFVTYFVAESNVVSYDLRKVLNYLNINRQFEPFSKGMIDTSRIVFFVSSIALFLFLSVKVVESRRWR